MVVTKKSESKQTEKHLWASEEHYRNTLDNMLEGCQIIGYDWRYMYINDAAASHGRRTKEELLGRTMMEVYPGIDKTLMFAKLRDCMKNRLPHRMENLFTFPDGSQGWFELSIQPVTEGIFILSLDITERRRIEEALRKSEQNFRNSLDGSPLGTRIVNAEGELLYANQAILDIYGYSNVEELKATPTKQRYTPQSYAAYQARKEKRKLGKPIPFNYEIHIVRRDSEVRHLAVLRKEVLWDGKKQFQSLYQDITERKQAEELLSTLTDSSPIGIYIVQNGKFQYVNPQVQRLLGRSQEELLGTDSSSYVLPKDTDLVRGNAIRMLKGERVYPYKYRVVNKAGKIKWVMESVTSIQYRGSRAVLGSFMDITQRKQVEKKMFEYEELDRLKSDLLSTVSHELRTPLATIKGYSTMLLDYDRRLKRDEKREHLSSIDRAADRLTELVEHLLDMSRLEAGLLKLERRPTSISKLIKEAVNDAKLRTHNHKMVLNLAKRLPKVNGDARRIRQVLDNIIDNALKYSKEGTEVVVSAQRVRRKLFICVADQGIGIPAKDLERVFDRMYCIEQRLTPQVGGVGLGLAICKGLVKAHGGRIWAVSEPGKGSTFYFTLPIKNKAEGQNHGEEA